MIDKSFPIVEQLIQNGLHLTQTFHQLLSLEAEYLKDTKDIDAFNELIAKKNELIPQLDQFSEQLGKSLKAEKLSVNREGIQQYFSKAKSTGLNTEEAENTWVALAKLSEQCQQLNEQNGAGIALLAQHAQRTLNILKGKPQFANTYGPDGTSNYDSSSNPIASV